MLSFIKSDKDNTMNVMQLAWKIQKHFKNLPFSNCLRMAWKICKSAKVEDEGKTTTFVSSTFSQYDYTTPVKRHGKRIVVENNPSDFRSIVTEFNYI